MKRFLFFLIVLLICMAHPLWAAAKHILTTKEVLSLAEKNSESLSEAQLRVLVREKEIDIAKAAYYPILNAEALDSVGFPGSSRWIGIEGLIGSPFRSGLSGGIAAKQLIYDFGRTKADVRASESQVEVARQTTKVTAYEVKVLALQVYYQCARFKAQENVWARLVKESELITKEAKHFVKTGQRSIVDNYLSDSETEEARTAHAFFAERLQGTIKELAVIIGKPAATLDCPIISLKLMDSLNPRSCVSASPFVRRAIAGVKVAQEKLNKEKANYRPIIIATASAGDMAKTHLVKKENYALGLGIVMPIIDFPVWGRIGRAKAELLAKQQDIAAQKQFIEELNAKLDQIISSAKTKIRHLNIELKIAREGFDVAKKRYFTLEGTLVDLREAWRNLARAETTIEDTQTELLQASGAKALLNSA